MQRSNTQIKQGNGNLVNNLHRRKLLLWWKECKRTNKLWLAKRWLALSPSDGIAGCLPSQLRQYACKLHQMSNEDTHSVNGDFCTKSVTSWLIFCALETFGIVLAFRFQWVRNLLPKKTRIISETRQQVQVFFIWLQSRVKEEVVPFGKSSILDFFLDWER